MNIEQKLISLGLKQLPQDSGIDGFDHSIVFVCSEEVAKIMKKAHKTKIRPDLMIVRRGFITNKGKLYTPKVKGTPISYSLVSLNHDKKIHCLVDITGKKIKGILGKYDYYSLGSGTVFTAAKHLEEWENRFLGNRINLNNL